MEITEVRIKLMGNSDDRLQAFCSITFDDCFVVRDLKIIEGTNGPFVAMPSRKLTSHCPQCGCKNHLRAAHCNQCGLRLKDDRAIRDQEGRAKLYADIAHPINSQCREMIQDRIIAEFQAEKELAQQPGYKSRYEDDYFDDYEPVPLHQDDDAQPPETERTESVVERAHVQPAQAEPQGPHKPPARQGQPPRPEEQSIRPEGKTDREDAPQRSGSPKHEKRPQRDHSSQQAGNDEFGAGIF